MKDQAWIDDLHSRIIIHAWQKLDLINAARFPKSYLSKLIACQITNALRDTKRVVGRVNPAIAHFNEQRRNEEMEAWP